MNKNKKPYASILKTVKNFRSHIERQGLNDLLSRSSVEQIKDIIDDYNEFIQAVDLEITIELKNKDIDFEMVDEIEDKKAILKHSEEMREIISKLEKSLNMKAFW